MEAHMERQFTATVYVLKDDKVLLHRHRKQGKYLPPGGHIEENETPVEAAIREVKEESGIDITIQSQENIWIKDTNTNAASFERPYLCLLENIPAYKDKKAHQHMDFIYLGSPKDNQELADDFAWYSLEEVLSLKVPDEIYPDTTRIIKKLLTEIKNKHPKSSLQDTYF